MLKVSPHFHFQLMSMNCVSNFSFSDELKVEEEHLFNKDERSEILQPVSKDICK